MKMTYELDVCTSSLGVFSSLWGFHRIGLLTYPPECTKVLYVSNNLAAHTTSANDHQNFSRNQGIVEGLFFLVVTAILLMYGDHIIPPNLRDNKDFCSYFRG